MKNLIQDTLAKIKKQHVVPEPLWKHQARKYGLWLAFALVVFLAAVSLSAAFDSASDLDWDLYRFMHQSRLMYFFSILPYFWVALLVFFLAIAFLEIRRTETGYRYSWGKILGITLGAILAFGIFMSLFGFGGRFHSMLAKNSPYYGRHMMVTKEAQWMQPEKGFLAGTIVSVSGEKLTLQDLDGRKWDIRLDEKTLIRPAALVSPGEMIKVIGAKESRNDFRASEIRPWAGRGMMRGGRGGGGMMRGN